MSFLTSVKRYTLVFPQAGYNPANAATVYFGAASFAAPLGVQGLHKIRFGHSGRIIKACLNIFMSSTAGSAETSTLYLRKNATTDFTVNSVIQHDQAVPSMEQFVNDALNIPFIATDSFEAKLVLATHATPPVGAIYTLFLTVESN